MTGWASRTVYAEWTKLLSVRSTLWLLAGIIALMAGIGALVNGATHFEACTFGRGSCDVDTTRFALLGTYVGQIPAIVLGVLVAGSEYAHATMRTTLVASPGRIRVYVAKAVVVAGPVLLAAVLAVAAALAVSRLIQTANGFTAAHDYPPLSLGDEPTLRAAIGTVLYFGLLALLSFGVAMALRDTAAALTTVLTLLFIFPILTTLVTEQRWHELLVQYSPMSAGLTVQLTRNLDAVPIGPWQGLGVLAAYSAAGLLAGAALFRLRDA